MSEPRPTRPPLSIEQRVAAAIGIFIMVFSGGCLLGPIISVNFTNDSDAMGFYGVVLVVGGIPFAIGSFILLAALGGRPGWWFIAAVGVAIPLAGAIATFSGDVFLIVLVGISFAAALLLSWLAIRVGR